VKVEFVLRTVLLFSVQRERNAAWAVNRVEFDKLILHHFDIQNSSHTGSVSDPIKCHLQAQRHVLMPRVKHVRGNVMPSLSYLM